MTPHGMHLEGAAIVIIEVVKKRMKRKHAWLVLQSNMLR